MTARTPLTVIDEVALHLDHGSDPWSVHCEVRVAGRLDAQRVTSAARAATAVHPLARARLSVRGRFDGRYHWEVDDAVDDVAPRVVDCPDDAAVAGARARLLSESIALSAAPPFALMLAHRPDGDSLILNLNHAAGDGIATYRLLLSICRAYGGVADPVPDVDPLAVRDPREHAGATSLTDVVKGAWGLGTLVPQLIRDGTPARLAVQGGDAGVDGYGVHLLRLRLGDVTAARRRPATINDLLVAALALAIRRFNDERGVAPSRITVAMPVNLRPAGWRHEIVSNFVALVQVPVRRHEQLDLADAQRAVAERTRALKQQRRAATMIDLAGLSMIAPVGVRRLAGPLTAGPIGTQLLDTAVLSNLGRLPAQPDLGEDAGPPTELWFSPPANMPMGVGVGVLTRGAEMFVAIRYSRAQFDGDGAAAFAATFSDALLGG